MKERYQKIRIPTSPPRDPLYDKDDSVFWVVVVTSVVAGIAAWIMT